MAEYIEREALMEDCKRMIDEVWNSKTAPVSWSHAYAEFLDNVERAPTADVAPVVHGQWIIGVDDDNFDVKCSKCGWNDIFKVAGIAAVERIAKTMHYCLNCGARVDGGDSDAAD